MKIQVLRGDKTLTLTAEEAERFAFQPGDRVEVLDHPEIQAVTIENGSQGLRLTFEDGQTVLLSSVMPLLRDNRLTVAVGDMAVLYDVTTGKPQTFELVGGLDVGDGDGEGLSGPEDLEVLPGVVSADEGDPVLGEPVLDVAGRLPAINLPAGAELHAVEGEAHSSEASAHHRGAATARTPGQVDEDDAQQDEDRPEPGRATAPPLRNTTPGDDADLASAPASVPVSPTARPTIGALPTFEIEIQPDPSSTPAETPATPSSDPAPVEAPQSGTPSPATPTTPVPPKPVGGSGGGGSSGGGGAPVPPDPIALYADSNTNPVPTTAQYAARGVNGVTDDNLASVNSAIDAATRIEADTVAEVQAIVDAMLRVVAYADDSSLNSAPSVADFALIHVTGVTAANLTGMQAALEANTPTNADTVAKVQAIVDGMAHILDYAADAVTNPAPAIADYAVIGVTGVDAAHLDAVNSAIAAVPVTAVETPLEVQSVADAMIRIFDYAADDSTAPAPTLGDFTAVGVNGVTASNLSAMLAAVAAQPSAGADTVSELQALVDMTAPTVTAVTSSTPDGVYRAGDVITIEVTLSEAVTVSGGAPTLTLDLDGTDRQATYVSGSGTNTLVFTYTVQPGDSAADLNYLDTASLTVGTALVTDAFGNALDPTLPDPTSAASLGGGKAIEVDSLAPPAPIITGLQAASDTGRSATDAVTQDATPTLVGTADPNVTIEVYEGATLLGSTTSDGTGAWSFTPTPALTAGSHAITAKAIDALLNDGALSTPLTVVVDNTGPAAPVIAGLTTATDGGSSSTDRLTNDSTPTVTGTTEANAIVELFEGTTSLGTTTADGSGNWSLTLGTPLTDSVHALTAKATDVAGNLGVGSVAVTVTIDTASPAVPAITGLTAATDTGSSNVDRLTQNTTPTLTGTAEAGATVQVFEGATLLGSTTADGTGNWTLALTTALSAGTHALTAKATDPAGNLSGSSAAVTVTVDTTASVPVVTGLSTATDTGLSNTDGITADDTPTIVGTAEANTRVQVYDGTTLLGTVTADGTGAWSLALTTALSAGSHTVTATSTDAAGNLSAASSGTAIVIDNAAPVAPVITGLTAATDLGFSSTDRLTSNPTPTVTGTAEANARVEVYSGATLLGTTTTDASGNWSFAPSTALAAGSHTLTAKAIDAASNVSPASAAVTLTIDLTPPGAPTVTGLTAATDTGANTSDSVTGNTTPTLVGTAEAGTRVEAFDGTTSLGTAAVDAGGNWAIALSSPLAAGTRIITVKALDAAGNVSATSAPKNVVIDNAAPTAPVVTGLAPASDTGVSATDGITSQTTPTLRGTAEANATVTIFDGATLLGTTTANATGDWSFIPGTPLAGGSHTLTAVATDAAGHVSATSSPRTIVIDTAGPAAPVISGLTAVTDTGASNNDGITANATPTVAGTAEPLSTVQVFDGGTLLGTTTANASGAWTYTPGAALAAGVHSLTARAVDAAGNVGPTSAAMAITIDANVPAVPTVTGLILNTDTGSSASDGITANTKPILSGTADPITTVQVFDGTTLLGSVVSDGTGAWSFTPASELLAGPHALTARAVGASGNMSAASAPLTVTVDTSAPGAPAITGLQSTSDTGVSATDGVSADTTPTLTGTAEANATVKLFDGTTLLGTVTADGTGAWSFTPASALAEGPHTLTAVAGDAAGHASAPSTPLAIMIDGTAPAAPAIAGLTAATDTGVSNRDGVTSNAAPTLQGTAQANAVVELFDGGTSLGTTTADALGQWSFIPAAPLSAGAHTLTAIATDTAGNLSPASAGLVVTIDSGAPSAPVVTGLLASTDTGLSTTDGLTRVARPTVVGTADADTTVLVFEGATLLGTTQADGSGNWSLTLMTPLAPGAHAVTARGVDAAGNMGPVSGAVTVTVDLTGPAAPVITGLTTATDTGVSATDGVTSNTSPTLTGTAEADATVLILEGTTVVGTVAADGTGNWSFTPGTALSAGSHSFTAIATDAAGNTSGSSSPRTITIDTAAPSAPVITGLQPATDSGASSADGLTNDATPTLHGTAEPGVTVQILEGTTVLGTATATASGTWSFTPTTALAAGSHTLTATALDASGQTSATSAALTIAIDTTASATPIVTGLTAATDLGASNSDRVTHSTTPTLTGTAEAEATVQVFDGGVLLGTTAADSAGNWSFTPGTALAVGAHAITASYVDRAGNASGVSAAVTVTIDAAAPGVPTVTGLTAASDTGASATDALTSNLTPTIVGTAEANATVKVFDGTALLGTATADGTGNWSFTPGAALAAGSHTISVVATDPAGNTSAGSAPRTIQIDAAAPASPVVSGLTAATDTGVSNTDGVTSVATPTIVGTAEANATVKVFDGATLLGTVTANAAGGWSLPLTTALTGGAHAITATATDAAGNVSTASVIRTVTVDTTAPAAPVISGLTAATDTGVSATDGVTSNATPTLQGTAEAGTTVRIFDGTTLLGTTVADGAGTWTFTPPAALSASAHVFKASILDLVGNTSPDSATHTVTVDATAPTAPTLTGLGAGADTGVSATDGLTNLATPPLVGTAEAGATVRIYDGTTLLGTTTADGSGNWTFTPPAALAAGTHTLTVATADAAGNVSAVSAAKTVTIDAVAPAVPTLGGLTPATDTGTSVIDGATANATPTFMGTAEPGATVQVLDGTTVLGTTTADASGNWSFTSGSALSASAHSITVKASDAAGNTSSASAAKTITIDLTGPATPVITGLTAASDTGTSTTDGLTANATPALTGTAEAGAIVQIYEGAALLGTTTASGAGVWSFTPPSAFSAGSHAITARASDAAGNLSAVSAGVTVTVDVTAPGAPTLAGITAASDTGASNSDRLTTNATPTFTGTADANGTVAVYSGSTLLGTATADGTGAWSFTPGTPLAAGVHSVRAVGTDAAGNASASSAAVSVTIDTAPPAAPVFTGLATGSDSGLSASDAITSDTTPTLTGTAEANATIKIFDGATPIGTTTADASGAWSFTTAVLSAGAHTLTATATDATGSTGVASSALVVTVDATAPGAPVITGLSAATDTGTSATDRLTSNPTPTIVGTAEANATVQILDGGTVIGTTTADGTGAWSFTPATALTASAHTMTAKAVDTAGNTSASSASKVVTVDLTAPAVPAVTGLTVATDTGASSTDGITTNTTPVITGTAETGSTVKVFDGATLLGTVTAAGGAWSLTPGTALSTGSHSLTAIATDAAGNVSAVSIAKTIAIDPGAPGAPVITGLAIGTDTGGNTEDGATNDDTPMIVGTADPLATVQIFDGATPIGTVTADAAGAWAFTPTTALAAGSHTLTATATDVAGNLSPTSAAKTISIDAAGPAAPVVTGLTAATDTGISTSDGFTYLTLPTLAGTAEPNATVRIYDGTTLLGTAAASAGGAWSFRPATALTEGAHTITAEAVDAAGNVSPASSAFTVTVDTTAPVTPVITGLAPLTDLGVSSTDGLTKDTTPTLVGTAEPNGRVNVYNGGTLLGTATADGTGAWSYTTSVLAAGTHKLTAKTVDLAGNESPVSSVLNVTIDATNPATPVISGLDATSDSGRSYADNITTDTTPTLVGTAEAGATVELFETGVSIGTTTADATGAWAFTPSTPFAVGAHPITAKAYDEAGGTSAATAAKTITVDTVAPVAPVVTGLGTGSDTGSSTTDSITNDVTPQLKGTAEGNATVDVYDGATLIGTTTAAAGGAWTLDLKTPLAHGAHTITATATDAAGTSGPASAAFAFTVDTLIPDAPVLGLDPLSDTGSNTADGITDDTTPTFSGTAEAGASVKVYDGATLKGTVTADASGNWTYTSTALAVGAHTITATATDVAGNVSAASNTLSLTVDTASTTPTVTGLTASTDTGRSATDAITANTRPTLVGTAEAGTVVSVFDGATQIGTVMADSTGDWSFTPSSPFSVGTHAIKVSYVDAAGNVSALSTAKNVVVDTTGTAAPVITGTATGFDTGSSTTDGITSSTTPRLSGTAEGSATVYVYDGTTLLGSSIASGAGAWTFDVPTLTNGTHTFTAIAADAAGNAGPASNTKSLTIDSGAPGTPVVTGITAATDTGTSNNDAITGNNKPTIYGTAEANAKVEVYNGATKIGTVTADTAGNWSFTPTTAIAVGTHAISATATDVAGNLSGSALSKSVTITTAAPTVTKVNSSTAGTTFSPGSQIGIQVEFSQDVAVDSSTGVPTMTLETGTTDRKAVYTSGSGSNILTFTYTVQPGDSSADLNYVATTSLALNGGTIKSLGGTNATLTLPALTNANSLGMQEAFVVNSTLPTKPIITGIDAADDTGSSTNDNYTSNTTPTITGVAPASATITVKDGATVLGTTPSDASGNWSFTPSVALTSATHSITATSTIGGVTSAASAAKSITVDTTAPAAPVVTGLTTATDLGTSSTDGITSDVTPMLRGTSEANATVEIYDGATLLGTTTASGTAWTFALGTALSAGDHTITAKAIDKAGNTSVASAAKTVTIDATAPATPVITGLQAGADSGTSSSDNITKDTTPGFVGTADPGAIVKLYDGPTLLGTVTADGTGAWSFNQVAPMTAGSHGIVARASDTAGNVSGDSTVYSVTIEASAPSVPVVTGLSAATDTGVSVGDAITSNALPTLVGTADPNATIQVLSGAAVIGTVTADAAGAWSFDVVTPLSGNHTITAKATDIAGNTSAASTAKIVTYDATAPAVTSVTSSLANGKFGPGDVITVNVVFGEAVTLNTSGGVPTLQLETGTTDRLATYSSGSGTNTLVFTYVVQPGDTSTDLNYVATSSLALNGATLTDTAGNTASVVLPATTGGTSLGGAKAIVIDTVAPAVPVVTGLTAATDLGQSTTDGITNDSTPSIMGTAEANATVNVYDGATLLGTATASGTGAWTLNLSTALTAGSHSLTARAVDTSGNMSAPSTAKVITIDTTAPTGHTLTGVDRDTDSGPSNSDGITKDTTPTFTGTAEAGATVQVIDGGIAIGTTIADASGQWTFTPATALNEGGHNITVNAIDVAGNGGTPTASKVAIIDKTTPAVPVLTGLTTASDTGTSTTDSITKDTTPTFSGTGEANATILVFDAGVQVGTTTVNGSNAWTYTPTSPLANGNHTFTFKTMDEAGNTSAATAVKTVTIDAAISVPEITGLLASSDTGVSTLDGKTTDTTPTLNGTADPGTSVQVLNGATVMGTVTASGTGTWSFTPSTALAAGSYNFTAKASDTAGNTSAASAVLVVAVDTAAPAAPVLTGVAAASDLGVSTSDGLTNDATPTLVGTAEAFASVKVLDGATVLGTVTADENGLWSFTPTTALSAGAHTITATATDAAGNAGVASAPYTVTLDLTAPTTPVISGLLAGTDTGSSATDGITANTTPTLTGTTEANAIVQILDGGTVVGSTTADGTGAWSFTFTSPLSSGSHPITAQAMDAAGNLSAVSTAKTLTIDGTAPTLPEITGLTTATDTGSSNTDGITSNTKPTLTGTAEAGTSVQIFDGATQIGAVTANASGVWSFTPTTALSAGSHAITAKAVDTAGNVSPTTGIWTVVVDATAPGIPTFAGLTAATDTGTSKTDGITTNATPTLTGTAEANATVQILEGATVIGTTTADGTGNWSFTPGTALTAGSHVLTTKTVDAAGNTSAASAAKTIVIDTTAAAAPTITGLTAATDTGSSSTDGVTNQTTPTLSGTAEANARIEVYDGATLLGTATANGTGAWSFTPTAALTTGSHSFTAKAVDAAGNTSPASTAFTVTVDGTAPATPAITGLTAATDTGTSATDGLTASASPTLVGTADANAIVKIYDGTTLLGSATADGTGAWSFTPGTALANGSHHLTAVATDLAGNASAASAAKTVVVDASTPVTPVFMGITAATDTGSSSADGVTSNATPTLQGTAEAGTTVKLFDGGTLIGSVTANTAGAWSFTPGAALSSGAHVITVTSQDAAGNVSAASSAKTITVDASAAAAPVITGLSSATDTGASNSDGVTKVTTPTLVGTGEAMAAVQIFDSGTLLGTTSADASGNWSFTPTALSSGAHNFTATMTDLAGNTSPASAVKVVTVDVATPTTPTLTGLTAASDTGTSTTDGLTANATPTLAGTAEANSTVSVYDGATLLGTTTASGAGTWSFTPPSALAAGSHSLTVTAADAAGNVSAASTAKTVVVDATAPTAPTVAGLTAATDTGASNADGVTSNAAPTLTGAAEAGSTVKVFDGATLLGTVTADAAGTWSLATPLAEGAHTITATATDAAGNLSAASAARTVTIDTTAPAAPVVTGLTTDTDLGTSATDRLTANARPSIAGTAEAGATVQVFDGGTLLGATTADGTGAWTFTPSTALAGGAHTITASFTDLIGNTSPTSAAVTVTIDATAPAPPVITGLTASSDTGASSTDGLTANVTPTLTGTADANAVVTIYDGGTLLGSATANGAGAWTFTPGTALAAGPHALTAIAADAAGNTSAASTVKSVVVDGAAPTAPVVSGLSAGTDTGASTTDGITSVTTPTLLGTAEAGAVVQVFEGATLLGTTTADATGAWSLVPGAAFTVGAHAITATATDASGRVSPSSAAATVTIVSSAPGTPVITGLTASSDTGASSTDGVTSHAAPTLTGNSAANATVQVFEGATLLGTTSADGTGSWSLTLALAAGSHGLTAIASDAAGNASAASGLKTITVDATPPATPVVNGLSTATDSGVSNSDGVTSVTTPAITGTAPAGGRVEVYDGGVLLGSTTADGTGNWSFTPAAALAAGSHAVTAVAIDAAGNASTASGPKAIVIEGATPPAPTVTGLTAATDTGASNTDGVTSIAAPTLTGTAVPNAVIQIYDGATLLGSTNADAFGAWSFTPGTALSAGSHTLTATATNASGATSAASAASTVVVTTTGPAATVVLGLAAGSDSGASTTDGLTHHTAPTILGTASANAMVKIFDGATLLGTTTADGAGAWSFTPASALAAGAHSLTASAVDAAGNNGAVSAVKVVTIDVAAPGAPVVTGLTAATDTGASSSDGVTSVATPTIVGTAEANATVSVYDGATLLGTATADGTGAWSFTPGAALAAGSHAITARASDAAGNVGASSAVHTIVMTGTAPDAPMIAGLTPATDTGTSDTDGVTGNATPTLVGTAAAHSTVRVFDGATLLGSTTTDAAGAWSFVFPPLSAGSHSVTATATDASGRISAAAAAKAIVINAGTPGAPVITGLTASSDTGASSTDGITSVAAPTLQGTAEANATVQIFDGATLLDTVTADGAGGWSLPLTTSLSAGTHSLTAVATSAAGNPGGTSTPFTLQIDLTNPASPVVTGLTASSDTGASGTDGTTQDTTPTLQGTAEAGATVSIYDGAALLGTTTASGTGTWSFTPGTALAEGVHNLAVAATDAAGHLSATSAFTAVTVDTTAPAVPTVSGPATTSDATPTLAGTAEAGSTVRVFDGATLWGTTTANGAGEWTFTPGSDLDLGNHTLTAHAVDAAGNLSGTSSSLTLAVEAPAAGYQIGGLDAPSLWFDASKLSESFEISTTVALAGPQETLKLSDVLSVPIATEGVLQGSDLASTVAGAPEVPGTGFFAPETSSLLLDSDVARYLA